MSHNQSDRHQNGRCPKNEEADVLVLGLPETPLDSDFLPEPRWETSRLAKAGQPAASAAKPGACHRAVSGSARQVMQLLQVTTERCNALAPRNVRVLVG